MTAIISLLIVLTLSLIVTRVAAMALMLTGLSRESARFQARSAFTGVGFTTGEAENVVDHPVRRQIVMLLMLLGNLGIGAVVATLMLAVLGFSLVVQALTGHFLGQGHCITGRWWCVFWDLTFQLNSTHTDHHP